MRSLGLPSVRSWFALEPRGTRPSPIPDDPAMKQLNFLLIFSFGLAMVMFTLENTAPTTVHFLPGLSGTLPLAALLLLVGGIGATAAWVFAVWTGVVRKVEAVQSQSEVAAQQVRIQELENDLQRYRATVDAQLGLLPAAGQTSADEAMTVSVS